MDKDIEDLFNSAATPVTPPPELKDSIMARIDATEQVTDLDSARKNHPGRLLVAAAAAAVVLIAGGGIAVTQFTVDESRESVTAQGVNEMHAIMEADDARQGQADAMGASLDIVISSDMGKGGAMVNGQPALDDGMGAQVWAVMEADDARQGQADAMGASLDIVISSDMGKGGACLLYTSPSPRDRQKSRMPSSA